MTKYSEADYVMGELNVYPRTIVLTAYDGLRTFISEDQIEATIEIRADDETHPDDVFVKVVTKRGIGYTGYMPKHLLP